MQVERVTPQLHPVIHLEVEPRGGLCRGIERTDEFQIETSLTVGIESAHTGEKAGRRDAVAVDLRRHRGKGVPRKTLCEEDHRAIGLVAQGALVENLGL